jgi:hypothetical protein
MNNDILNPGTIRVWGYDFKNASSLVQQPEILKPETYYKGVRCTSMDFRRFFGIQKVNTRLFRSIIRKVKQK